MRQSVPTARITVDERLIEMQVGETKEIKPIVLPLLTAEQAKSISGDAAASALLSMLVTDKIEYASSNTEIATVDENGIVTAKKEGSCKITAKSGSVELVCNILVNVPINEWASEEFLEYVERIGAYTELPLGTDGSAGPTAQYVTFGWELTDGEIYHYTEDYGGVDARTETTYKGYNYRKGEDDEWYYQWDSYCYDDTHDHSELLLKSEIRNRYKWEYDEETGERKRIPYEEYEYTYPPLIAYRIHPRKWRLLDKEKGLMVMENYDDKMGAILENYKTFSLFYYNPYGDIFHYAYHNKSDIERLPVCNYETSYLRAWLDGGEYLECFNFVEMKDGNFRLDGNGKQIYANTQARLFRMNERRTWTDDYGRYKDYDARTNTGNTFQNFFTPNQLAQIQNVDLDCGEGGSVKGRLFILSEDEIKKYYSDGSKLCPWRDWGDTYWTRTRKKIDGKNTLCVVKTNYDGAFKKFVQLEAYDTGDMWRIIPAICVAPAPQK